MEDWKGENLRVLAGGGRKVEKWEGKKRRSEISAWEGRKVGLLAFILISPLFHSYVMTSLPLDSHAPRSWNIPQFNCGLFSEC